MGSWRRVRSEATDVELRREEKEVRFWKEARMEVMLGEVTAEVESAVAEEDRRRKQMNVRGVIWEI